jgi:hypothetical protein
MQTREMQYEDREMPMEGASRALKKPVGTLDGVVIYGASVFPRTMVSHRVVGHRRPCEARGSAPEAIA